MMRKFFILPSVALLVLLLAACGGNPPSAQPTPTSSPSSGAVTVAPSTADTTVVTAAGPDADGDGVPDTAESLLGTDPNNADTDGDGQNDRVDNNPIVAENPITETSTTVGFTINSILVENNVDANNQPVSDHLELSITNTANTDLTNFDIFYTITDPTTNHVEAYYQRLTDFTLRAGETASIHFDNAGQPAHFKFNPNSLYYTNQNQLVIDATLHAAGYAPQTATVNKDPGGEGGVE